MQVLSEHLTFDQAQVVVESSNEGKDLYMKGICIQGNVKNANQRVYPTYEINKAVQKISDQIAGGSSVLGEVDHPEDLKINLYADSSLPLRAPFEESIAKFVICLIWGRFMYTSCLPPPVGSA